MGNLPAGTLDMQEASREKATSEHSVIDDAIRDQGDGYTVFSIPVGVLYRPNERKLKNAGARDYMGKARLVAASEENDAFTGFTGVTRLNMGITPTNTFVSQPTMEAGAGLSRANTAPPSRVPAAATAGAGLGRSKTTLNVSSNARERITGRAGSDGAITPGPGIARAASLTSRTGPVRGLSVRKGPAPVLAVAAVEGEGVNGQGRLTEFYDDYIDSYGERDQPPLPPLPTRAPQQSSQSEKISAWARETSPPHQQSQAQQGKRSPPPSTYAPSSYGGGTIKRKLTRRGTARRAGTGVPSMYEEEEGYASGSEDAGFELIKIRVKVRLFSPSPAEER